MGKLPPQAPELEASVIGAMMIEKDAFASVADLLRPETFYSDQHRHIYEAIRALSVNEAPIDVLSVAEQLKKMGTLEVAGGVVYLSELTQRVASGAHGMLQLRSGSQQAAQRSGKAAPSPQGSS